MGWPIGLGEPAIGRRDCGDAGQGQLLRQPVLQGAEGALETAARLGRISCDVADAELAEGAPDLRSHGLRDRFAGLGRMEIVAASVGIELAEQPVPVDHLGQRTKARCGALLLDHKARVDRAGRVVESDHQIVLPIIARQPGEAGRIPRFREGRL